MRVAFLGLGRMGRAMAHHLLDAGHDLTVWNRSKGKADELVEAGATEADSIADAVGGAEAIVLMLFGPDVVREVLPQVGDAADEGALVIDSTTNGPAAAREFGELVRSRGLRFVDAPVVGSVKPAQEGTLGVLMGGSDEDVKAAHELVATWGDESKIRHVGEVGAGNALKTVVNLTLGVAMGGIAEALRLGHDLGLEREVMLQTLANGPLGTTTKLKQEMLSSNEFPAEFSLDLMLKDLRLALTSGEHELPVTASTAALAEAAVAAGHGDDDFAAMAGYFANEGVANSH